MFVCGSGSFGNQEEDIDDCSITSPTYKKSKRSISFCKIIGKDYGTKNPYADRGLDKFNELLAYLDQKKQQIYTTKGSDHISYVRFVHSDDYKRVKPIIVVKRKSKKKNKQEVNSPKDTLMSHTRVIETVPISSGGPEVVQSQVCRKIDTGNKFSRHGVKEDLRQPLFYVTMTIVLILVFLALFGRTFAIFCTLIAWYSTPMIRGGTSTTSSKRSVRKLKKDHVKENSANNLVPDRCDGPSSPTSVLPSALRNNENQQ